MRSLILYELESQNLINSISGFSMRIQKNNSISRYPNCTSLLVACEETQNPAKMK